MVVFNEAVSQKALYSLTSLPGVTYAEPFRSVPVRLRSGNYVYRTSIQGFDDNGRLRRLLDRSGSVIPLPEHGLLLTDYLARVLHIRPGDMVSVEVMEGRRGTYQVPLAGVVSEYIGVSAYMRRDALNRLLREGGSASGAYLAADMTQAPRHLHQPKGDAARRRHNRSPPDAGKLLRNDGAADAHVRIFQYAPCINHRGRASSTIPRELRSANAAANWPACACSATLAEKFRIFCSANSR